MKLSVQHTENKLFICCVLRTLDAAREAVIRALFVAVALVLVLVQPLAAEGVAVPETYSDVVRWYHKAAESGDRDAQFLLAVKYETGTDVPRDKAKALAWFKQAAEQGHVEAQFKLALIYSGLDDKFRDLPEAVRWTEASARNGYGPAQYNLGVAYLNGAGLRADPVQALAWLDIASRAGVSGAAALRRRLLNELAQEQIEIALKLAERIAAEMTNGG